MVSDPKHISTKELKSRVRSWELVAPTLNPAQQRFAAARIAELMKEIEKREEQRDADT